MGGCMYSETKIMDVVNPQASKPEEGIILKSNQCNSDPSCGKGATIILTSKEEKSKSFFQDIKTSLTNVSKNSLPPIKTKQHPAKPFAVVIRELAMKSKKGVLRLKDEPLALCSSMRSDQIEKQERIQIGHSHGSYENLNFQRKRE